MLHSTLKCIKNLISLDNEIRFYFNKQYEPTIVKIVKLDSILTYGLVIIILELGFYVASNSYDFRNYDTHLYKSIVEILLFIIILLNFYFDKLIFNLNQNKLKVIRSYFWLIDFTVEEINLENANSFTIQQTKKNGSDDVEYFNELFCILNTKKCVLMNYSEINTSIFLSEIFKEHLKIPLIKSAFTREI